MVPTLINDKLEGLKMHQKQWKLSLAHLATQWKHKF